MKDKLPLDKEETKITSNQIQRNLASHSTLSFTLDTQNHSSDAFPWRLGLDSNISSTPTLGLSTASENLFSRIRSSDIRSFRNERELTGEELSLSCGQALLDYPSGEGASSSSRNEGLLSLSKEVDTNQLSLGSSSSSGLGVGALANLNAIPSLGEEIEFKAEEEQWPPSSKRPSQTLASSRQSTRPRSVAERMRRGRISMRLERLKATLPNTNPKLDTAAMLDDAVKYINSLKKQIRRLEEEASILRQQIPPQTLQNLQVSTFNSAQLHQQMPVLPQITQIQQASASNSTALPFSHSINPENWRTDSNQSQDDNAKYYNDFRGPLNR